jgi:hypothetical protein
LSTYSNGLAIFWAIHSRSSLSYPRSNSPFRHPDRDDITTRPQLTGTLGGLAWT